MALRAIKATLVVSAIILLLFLFLHIAQVQGNARNPVISGDQVSFLEFAKRSFESSFHFTGGRNQMPLYPWIQALFYSPDLSDEAFFEQAKEVNIWLSLMVLAAMGIAFFAKFSRPFATWSVLSIAFLIFAIKSPYLLAENLYYGLFAFAFIVSLESLYRPKWYKSVACGALFALAHFTKASALPALVLFTSSYGVLFLTKLTRRQLDLRSIANMVFHAFLPVFVFLVLLSPYLLESKAKFGSYFYNVNTSIYMWYDTWADAKAATREARDPEGHLDLPADQIPSLQMYLPERGLGTMLWRFFNGAKRLMSLGCFDENSRHSYGYCSQVGISLLAVSLCLPFLLREKPWRKHMKHAHIAWFVLVFFFVYSLGAAWYVPITGNTGARMILLLYIPLLWTVGLICHAPRIRSLQFTVLGRELSVFSLVLGLMSVTLTYEIYLMVTVRASTMSGGS